MRIILWLIGGYGVFTIIRILTQFHLFDFAIYYRAVQDLGQGLSMYQDTTIAMKYPMSAMILLTPIGWLPYNIVEKLWTMISLLSLGLSLWWLAKLLPELKRSNWIWIVATIILSFPYKFTLGMGQINLMILAGLVGSLYAYYLGHDIWAGILIALCAWIKITPLVLLLFFWRKGRYKTIMTAIVVYIVGWVLAGQIWGYEVVREFFVEVIPSISTMGNYVYYNQALTGLIARLGIEGNLAVIINYGLFVVMLTTSYMMTSRYKATSSREITSFGLFLISMILGSGLAWQHYFVWTIIPFVGIYAMTWQFSKQNIYACIGVAYILIAMNIKHPGDLPMWAGLWLSHATLGSVILWLTGVKMVSRIKLYN